ncbi:MAG: hypothetical protein ABI210_09470 [Abditibacteriaceae bacterium]
MEATTLQKNTEDSLGRKMLNKVPEITIFFWIVKVLCTTVGETAADYLNFNLHLGLTNTSYLMGALLVIALFFQFKLRKYVAGVYWLVVVLLSIVGTLITDNLSDNLHVPLIVTTVVFSIALIITFAVWYWFEKSLSIHTIYTSRREAFYWLAILFTFSLGTAAGDLVAEQFALGYFVTLLLVVGLIAAIAIGHFRFKLNEITAFWLAYILTRPLGASLGDLLSQSHKDGGLGISTTVVSVFFLTAILISVIYLSATKLDVTSEDREEELVEEEIQHLHHPDVSQHK